MGWIVAQYEGDFPESWMAIVIEAPSAEAKPNEYGSITYIYVNENGAYRSTEFNDLEEVMEATSKYDKKYKLLNRVIQGYDGDYITDLEDILDLFGRDVSEIFLLGYEIMKSYAMGRFLGYTWNQASDYMLPAKPEDLDNYAAEGVDYLCDIIDAFIGPEAADEQEKILSSRLSVRISVDYENNAEEWWDAARESTPPAPMRAIIFGHEDQILVSPEEAQQIEEWASSLPGWDDGPAYASNPLLIG